MTTMNRTTAKMLVDQVKQHLQNLPAEFGVTIGHVTFDPDAGTATFKMTIGIKENPGDPNDITHRPEYKDLAQYAEWNMYNLTPENFTKVFKTARLGEAELVGFKTRSRKYPFLVRQISTGKVFGMTADFIERTFAKL